MDVRDSWPKITVMAALLVVLVFDGTEIPAFSIFWFRMLYALAALGLIAWRWTYRHTALLMFGSCLATASGCRCVVYALDGGNHWSSAAVNGLLTIFAFGYTRNRHGVEYGREVHGRLDRRTAG